MALVTYDNQMANFSILVTIMIFLIFGNTHSLPILTKRGDLSNEKFSLPAMQNFSGDATFYDVGLGSCGKVNSNDQLVAAISHELYDSFLPPDRNPNNDKCCGRRAEVTRGKRSVKVFIVDRCGSCDFGSIDLSPAAFNCIARPEEGNVHVTWRFI
ncbi:5035_t:CDS:2 [Acaulospora morrowiae]|uniref:5035_t:CDS:1 n=1 Tax=Acaulospora morrowiae TaxID=94023 RepID=A0A9N9I0R2_9GLOM|nr:5035_t:CDS:2 [Acaulospora morrowiae]